ncbi:ISAs1 family transposase [Parashewanella spongiae]|uniref:ISAs1 family transposase n=1 Tax=Parashewanella spongiae TaxID=342950 RepID=UPI0014046D44|nr:ISAs1 family transposase [Parashewanella spongiae]
MKKNQGKLLAEIEAYFHKCYRDTPELLKQNHFTELDGEHGQINERHYRLLPITNWFDETAKFVGCQAVVEVTRMREMKNKSSHETSYYITSLASDVEGIARYIRKHWTIENSQHWALDVTFNLVPRHKSYDRLID